MKGLPCGAAKDCPKGTQVPSGGAFFLFYAFLITIIAYESIGYWNTFWESMGYLFLVTLVLTVINLMLISGTRLEKKV